eukprot:gene9793-biopygen22756
MISSPGVLAQARGGGSPILTSFWHKVQANAGALHRLFRRFERARSGVRATETSEIPGSKNPDFPLKSAHRRTDRGQAGQNGPPSHAGKSQAAECAAPPRSNKRQVGYVVGLYTQNRVCGSLPGPVQQASLARPDPAGRPKNCDNESLPPRVGGWVHVTLPPRVMEHPGPGRVWPASAFVYFSLSVDQRRFGCGRGLRVVQIGAKGMNLLSLARRKERTIHTGTFPCCGKPAALSGVTGRRGRRWNDGQPYRPPAKI